MNFLLKKIKEKYSGIDYNLSHILKSLVYFQEAEDEPMPRMHKEISWEKIKEELVGKIKEYSV